MKTRGILEANLVKAEAALLAAVSTAARLDGNRVEASERLDQARSSCRDAYAALAKFKRTER